MNQYIAVSESHTDRFPIRVILCEVKEKVEAMYVVYTRDIQTQKVLSFTLFNTIVILT